MFHTVCIFPQVAHNIMRQCSPSGILSLFLFFFCLSLSFYPFFSGTDVVFIFFAAQV
jgi:hypothetical protein